ncbi:MAG TPA: outer membrane beta-barrel protein [Candidatus Angelobacter sp.]|nr:outer membrane beta-barrel protein [Candidatus Angelobacter sp.]
MRNFVVLGFLLLAFSLAGFAQHGRTNAPGGEVYVGYSLLNGDTLDTASGFELGLTGNVNDWLGLTADFSGNFTSDSDSHEYNVLFGPQITHRMDRLSLFGHGLVGIAHFSAEGGIITDTSAGWVLGGGADYKLRGHFAWRIAQLDYHGSHLFSSTQKDLRVFTGLVLRF